LKQITTYNYSTLVHSIYEWKSIK